PFLVADKFMQEIETITTNYSEPVPYLNFHKKNLTILEQKIAYGKLHRMYKKVLNKALDNHSKSQQLIKLLEEFIEEADNNNLSDSKESSQGDSISDKENYDPATEIQVRNPKKCKGKGRPPGTKRFKSSHKSSKSVMKNQRRCKKCGNAGHYQKNCKAEK
ncbi:1955_t:CDS:2, partial [Racocetra fulgida]